MIRTLTFDIATLVPYIDWVYFLHAWGFPPRFSSIARVHECAACRSAWIATMPEEDRLRAQEIIKLYDDAQATLKQMAEAKVQAKARVGLFPTWSENEDIVLVTTKEEVRLNFLRQQHSSSPQKPNYCLADYIAPRAVSRYQEVHFPMSGTLENQAGLVLQASAMGVFAATVHAEQMKGADDAYHTLMVETLTQRLAEACAERMYEVVRKEIWGYASAEDLAVEDILTEKYVGLRPAVGYPSLPDLSLNFDLDGVIDFGEIGVSLTESGMMVPQSSVSGLLFAHPKAQHFAVGRIGEDQLKDYASRRGKSVDELRKYLKYS